jgi:hypothetical protein
VFKDYVVANPWTHYVAAAAGAALVVALGKLVQARARRAQAA